MIPNYIAPAYQESPFNCPHCGYIAKQRWYKTLAQGMPKSSNPSWDCSDTFFSKCDHCSAHSIWTQERLVFPDVKIAPEAHQDMPGGLKADFEEARSILSRSPRGAAALLRLVIQKLMPILGENNGDINKDIGALVSKGLPLQIQQSLDAVRVIGNSAVHGGTIDLNDTPDVAVTLFRLVNFIVEDRIARPKQLEALYNSLPEDKRKGIENRDKPKSQP